MDLTVEEWHFLILMYENGFMDGDPAETIKALSSLLAVLETSHETD